MTSQKQAPYYQLAIWLVAIHTGLVVLTWLLRDSRLVTHGSPLLVVPILLGVLDMPVHILLMKFRSISMMNDYMLLLLGLGGLQWCCLGMILQAILRVAARQSAWDGTNRTFATSQPASTDLAAWVGECRAVSQPH